MNCKRDRKVLMVTYCDCGYIGEHYCKLKDENMDASSDASTSSNSTQSSQVHLGTPPKNVKSNVTLPGQSIQSDNGFKIPLVPANNNSSQKRKNNLQGTVSNLEYDIPTWCSSPPLNITYLLTEIKSGVVMKETRLMKSHFVVGRGQSNDIILQHKSVSRNQAVIQFGSPSGSKDDAGYYLFDLQSANGTIINKRVIKPRLYYPLKDGYVFKFGYSTRIFTLDLRYASSSSNANGIQSDESPEQVEEEEEEEPQE